MGNYLGGSAYSMAQQIGDGYVLVTERTFARMLPAEIEKLSFELEKLMREVRAEQPAFDDVQAIQVKNRKLGRLRQCMTMVHAYRARTKR